MIALPQDAVIWGRDALPAALARLAEFGVEKPLLMAIPAVQASAETDVLPIVKDLAGRFSALPPHAPDHAVEAALSAALSCGARSILAYGGGSVLDAAKAVSHLHFQQTGHHLPIAALPTTLSGSEFSGYFGITETLGARRFKRSYAVRSTVPRLVVLDPVQLRSTPRVLLLASAIKSMDHAIEGMRRVGTEHPHAIMAASGVRRFFATLPKVTDAGFAPDDLLSLQLASWHCYFAPAAVKYGLSHRIGHILGGTFGMPHSLTSCITLAPVIRACAAMYEDRLSVFAATQPGKSAPLALAEALSGLLAVLGLPTHLNGIGPDRQHLPEIEALLRTNYPQEVGDLGPDAETRLSTLLAGLWL